MTLQDESPVAQHLSTSSGPRRLRLAQIAHDKLLFHCDSVNSQYLACLSCSHMTMSGFYRGCCTFIFTHHKEIVPYLLSSQNPQLQDTPGSGTHCVGFYPCFQADCEQLGQLTQYRSSDTYQWQIQDFPEEGAPTPQGVPTYKFAKFSQKLHEIERIWTPGGHASLMPPLDPPLHIH